METRTATAIASGTPDEVSLRLIDGIRSGMAGVDPALIAFFASPEQPMQTLASRLKKSFPSSVLIGSSSSGEFTEKGDRSGAASVFAVSGDFKVFAGMGTGLKSDAEKAVQSAISALPLEQPGFPHHTGILLLDALAGVSEEVTLLAASLLGEQTPLAGGAASDDMKMKQTLVSLDGHVATDAVVIAMLFSKKPLGLGVSHGHEPISPPLRITKSEGNVVHEIEGRPAWQVWKEYTRAAAAKVGLDPDTLPADQVAAYLDRYEAGLSSGRGLKIRVPLSKTGDSLNFACGLPTRAVIRITESIPERQIESARTAARLALAQSGDAAGALVFDCVCRKLILADRFGEAVRAIGQQLNGAPLAGFETYGEIALAAEDMSGFHNTSTVVLTFPK